MILIPIISWLVGGAFLFATGYSLAMSNAHRRMGDAWMRCMEITLKEFPSHVDEEWLTYHNKITDQFKNW